MSSIIKNSDTLITRDTINPALYDAIKEMFTGAANPSADEVDEKLARFPSDGTKNDINFRHAVKSYAIVYKNQKNKQGCSFGTLDNYFCFFKGAKLEARTNLDNMPDFLDVDLLVKRQHTLRDMLKKERRILDENRQIEVNEAIKLIKDLNENLKLKGLFIDKSEKGDTGSNIVLYDGVLDKTYNID